FNNKTPQLFGLRADPHPTGLFLALGLISLVENILVVMAIIKNRNLHSPMYYFICLETIFMLFSDHGLLDVHPGMLRHLDNIIDVMICSSVVSSLSFLSMIAADRYITIFYALRYHSIVTTQRAVAIIVVVWLASITASILFIVYYTDNAVIVCLVTFFFTTLVFNVVLYLHMFFLAHVHSRRIMAFNKNRRHPFCNCFFRNFNLFLILIICNSLIDPLIYAYRSRELRKTLQELILCSCDPAVCEMCL
uniref:Melanocortin 1 receptor n=1 Tax=Neogobius melanostomus TaxID=47308 RepID=A0A8C6SKC5_9GOBI